MSQARELYRFEKYTGQDAEVHLPEWVDEKPLGIIGSKAFLSCKTVEKLYLPSTLETVEAWGFAHMKSLRELIMPAKAIAFGKQVFLGCESLQRVMLYPVRVLQEDEGFGLFENKDSIKQENSTNQKEIYSGIPYFLASMFRFFPEESLQNPALAGDCLGQWQWLAGYDDMLLKYINQSHEEGFVPAFIGWFDVEDVDDQKVRYMVEQREHKICLAFQRLQYDSRLQDVTADELRRFLLRESDLVEELFLERSDERQESLGRELVHYKIWQQSGGLDRQRAEVLLRKLPEGEPEIRGYLLNMQLEDVGNVDFFGELEL